jgi:hypothetical protein
MRVTGDPFQPPPLTRGSISVMVWPSDVGSTAMTAALERELTAAGAVVTSDARLSDLIVAVEAAGDPIPKLEPLLAELDPRQRQRLVVLPPVGGPPDLSVSDHGYLRLTGAGEDARAAARALVGRTIPEVDAERRLRDLVSALLVALDLAFDVEPAVGGARPDFLALAPDNRLYVVEANGRSRPSVAELLEATTSASRLAEAAGADAGLAVFATSRLGVPATGAVGYGELEMLLRSALAEHPSAVRAPNAGVGDRANVVQGAKSIFVAMPFAAEFDDVYFVAMLGAAAAVGAACRRLDHEEFVGEIGPRMTHAIRSVDAFIADISGANPNVMYELAYAHALNIPAVHISNTPPAELPFDVRAWNTIIYERGRTHLLRTALEKRLRAVLP